MFKTVVFAAAAVAVFGVSRPAFAQQTFTVGQAVEVEASDHWVPCVVTKPAPDAVLVNCEAYPLLRRGAGTYLIANSPRSIRKAGGAAAPKPAATAPKAPAGPVGSLKIGEYACYGSGGRIMIGLGFKVLPGNRYTDLDNKNAGTFAIKDATVIFRGGHLGGQTGRELKGGNFRIGLQADCEPF